ncbi:cysteine hydrolase [Acrocarpospora pleiomorpha]|uniref:Cysteine hydrolase n=1 Tax=Acrocarpospora pleiomorpha TaxID=90975 RepID=A0A5M3XE73_9ACTN|nr:isochorismatase family protein [Acrocarpospora pleiomorpha]GES18469.1 cysteine hydrolase [Acrocarpospora pleiomorpha]
MTTVPGTTPYPWPWHGRFDPVRLALLAVACPHPADRGQVVDPGHPVEVLAGQVRGAGGLIISVRVRPPGWPPAPPAEAPPRRPDQVVHAAGWDGFHGSDLDSVLRAAGRDLLLLAGCCLELGVHSTMRAANDRGYECLLVEDACGSAAPDLRQGALSTIEMSGGIFGAVGSRSAVATLMERS